MFKHLHIVACSPRSGTTLLHEAMITCFRHDRHYDHEIRFNKVSRNENNGILITKRPKDTVYMEPLLKNLDNFYVIYLLRDPRDVISSRHSKDKTRYYSNIRLWKELHEAANSLRGYDNFLEIKYENLVTEPDETQALMKSKFPWLEQLHSFSEYHKHAKVSEASAKAMHNVRPMDASSVGIWKNHLARIKGQQERHGSMTPTLMECGYEESGNWESVLEGTKPDLSPSYYPEKVSAFSKLGSKVSYFIKVRSYLS